MAWNGQVNSFVSSFNLPVASSAGLGAQRDGVHVAS